MVTAFGLVTAFGGSVRVVSFKFGDPLSQVKIRSTKMTRKSTNKGGDISPLTKAPIPTCRERTPGG